MEIKEAFDILSDCLHEWIDDADWFESVHATGLAKLYRFGQKAIYDFIDAAREECKTIDDIFEFLTGFEQTAYWMSENFQKDHFDHLAELWRYSFEALRDAESAIERNM